MTKKILLMIVPAFAAALIASADLSFAGIFSSHQVLQREMNVPVWGFGAATGQTVTVTFNGQTRNAVAGPDGTWRITLDPMTANATGQNLTVSCNGSSVTLTNVVIGEVWLCGGQSNMERTFSLDIYKGYTQREADRLLANYPDIRFRKLLIDVYSDPLDNLRKGPYISASTVRYESWRSFTPSTASDSSSLPYYFAKKLHEELGVPIGLIQHAISGSGSYTWLREDILAGVVGASELQSAYNDSDADVMAAGYASWQALEDAQDAWVANPNRTGVYPPGTSGLLFNRPTVAFNAMVNPIAGYAVRGMIWHRGEGSEGYDLHAEIYKAMITHYRQLWGANFHVIAGSLSNIGTPAGTTPEIDTIMINKEYLMNLRDDEGLNQEISGFKLVSFQDLGNYWRDDISQAVKDANGVHYEAKDVAGFRMALTALSSVYSGSDPDYKTPVFNRAFVDSQHRVRIRLDDTGSGISARPENFMGDNKGFVIKNQSGTLYYADFAVDGDQLLVWNNAVTNPSAVYYSWHDNPKLTIYNSSNLPVLYFRALSFDPLTPGDADLDGAVNTADLNRLTANWGLTSGAAWGDGDFSGDGAVNQSDLDIYWANADAENVLVSTGSVSVAEGGTASFGIKLSGPPVGDRTVQVARISGDTDLSVSGAASLVFSTNNWNSYQTCAVQAAQDADWFNGSAVFRCSSDGYVPADVTVTEDDDEEDPAYRLPWTETFENTGTNAGALGALNGQNGWTSTGVTVTNSAAQGGTQSARLSAGFMRHTFVNGTNEVWISFWAKPVAGSTNAAISTNATAVFWINTNGYLVAYSNATAVMMTGCQVASGEWNKFEIHNDYVSKQWKLSLNGTNLFNSFGFYSAGLSRFAALGSVSESASNAFMDTISIALSDPNPGIPDADGDGIPDAWETQYFGGPTNANSSATASNGINTIMQCYIAGINPTNAASVFLMSGLRPLTSGNTLQWQGVSGRVYNVYWSSNLLGGFQPFATNVPWTGNVYTDAVHGAGNQGFYKIEVRLEP